MSARRYATGDELADLEERGELDHEPRPESPLMTQFDRGVAVTGYVLLITSIFTAGLTSLGAYALASAHSHAADPVAWSHYRNQIRIFWAGVLAFVLGVACALVAAALALSQFAQWLQANFHWASDLIGGLTVALPGSRGELAGYFAVGAVVLVLYGMVHTAASSVWGAMRLLAGRPITRFQSP